MMINIKLPELDEVGFFEQCASYSKVVPLNKECKDCAMQGYYNEIADMLLKHDEDLINRVVDTWFCHNNCNRGCKGIRNYIEKLKPKDK